MKIIEEFDKEKRWFDIPPSKEDEAKKMFKERYNDIYWTSVDGIRRHLNEMSLNHIANCISYLLKLENEEYKQYWSTIFRLELIKRDRDHKELSQLYEELSSDFKCLEKWYDQEKIKVLENQIVKLKYQVKERLIIRNLEELQNLRKLTNHLL